MWPAKGTYHSVLAYVLFDFVRRGHCCIRSWQCPGHSFCLFAKDLALVNFYGFHPQVRQGLCGWVWRLLGQYDLLVEIRPNAGNPPWNPRGASFGGDRRRRPTVVCRPPSAADDMPAWRWLISPHCRWELFWLLPCERLGSWRHSHGHKNDRHK